jgi:hypothetical protein
VGGDWSAGPASLAATLSRDLERVKGWYLDLSGGVSLPLSATVAVEPALHLGFAVDENPNPADPDEEYWYQRNGLVDGGVALGCTYTASNGFSLSGAVHYAHRFDGATENEDVTWVSVKVGYWP